MRFLSGIPVYVSKSISTNEIKNFIFEFFLIRKLKKVDLNKVEIVHSWDFLPGVYKFVKSKNPKIKIIQDVAMAFPNVLENIKDKEEPWKGEKLKIPEYMKKAIRYIDVFVAPSEFVKESLINEGIGEKKIYVIPFGVDIERFKPLKNKNYGGKFKVAFVGAVNHRKGIKYLVKAWKELNLRNAELNLYGRVYPDVRKYLKNAGVYNIKIHGFVDISKELSKNSIYVFPSLLEGSSKSTYEALACGLPVITTFNSGSVVNDGKEGFIIPVQDAEAIKDKILFFYNNRKEIEKFGEKARELAEKYTWGVYAENINKAYENILG
ncbi:MAG: glycosyl transferase family 1 [Candidatus Altiarchaeales archaeon WOR_SM1_86-2]|nr:MAG: glycosyl transferase family 1 [Candidatus Altiarchaeales archaeon WOR_SM1_86-2]ODS40729.1 MAG: glycosyl transferase family 1 [Candidatus Altiarchaeales archaeon WOR_SM1_79]